MKQNYMQELLNKYSCKPKSERMVKIGDKVIMNNKYYVSEENRNKKFVVKTNPQEVCGTLSVWLEGFQGCYAVDGLTKVD